MHLPPSLEWHVWAGRRSIYNTWSSVLYSRLLRFVQITGLKVNLNRFTIYSWVTGILRKLLLTLWKKLLISLEITLCHLAQDLYYSLTFTMGEKKENQLPFLGVLVELRSFAFVTSIYRKPTFTGLYLSWGAFSPKSRKVNLIKCLTFSALIFVQMTGLKVNLNRLKEIFLRNRYPEEVIVDTMKKTVDKFRNNIVSFGPPRCPVYVRLPWTGSPRQLITDKVSSSVSRYFNAALVGTIFTTQAAFRSTPKDVLAIFQLSNLIYKFQCCCNATYIGRTSQRLEVRVK